MAKQMLVSYLDRKKVFLIPGSVVNELQFLREKFEKEFKFDHQSNVNLDINFQKYNKEWDEYVDLDDGCILGQREKLKAVVTPILVSGSSQGSTNGAMSEPRVQQNSRLLPDEGEEVGEGVLAKGEEVLDKGEEVLDNGEEVLDKGEEVLDSGYAYSRRSRKKAFFEDSSDEDKDEANFSGVDSAMEEDRILEGDSEHVNVSPCPEAASVAPSAIVSETPTRKRPRIVKSEDDRTPLPNPFPLPKHYRSDVELALASGKMTFDTTAAFLSSIAAAMLVFKRYPTPDDYTCVGRSIIAKYPFFSSPAGTPYGAISESLANRFKEFRRKKVKRNKNTRPTTPRRSPRKKNPGITESPSEPLPIPGEDSTSFERHNRMLKVEYKKTRRNSETVCDLMDRTFAFRRKDILHGSHDLDSIFNHYPFLQESEQVMTELDRIMGKRGLQKEAGGNWATLDLIAEFKGNEQLCALMLLPSLVPDARCKVDLTKIIYPAKGSRDIKKVVKKNTGLEPYFVLTDHEEDLQAYLVVDKQIIDKVSLFSLPYALMASFFVYNICYPKGCTNFYTFLEIILLNYSVEKASPRVKFLLAKLNPS